jgi:hypothetical protein
MSENVNWHYLSISSIHTHTHIILDEYVYKKRYIYTTFDYIMVEKN